jgi:hypothetical protein
MTIHFSVHTARIRHGGTANCFSYFYRLTWSFFAAQRSPNLWMSRFQWSRTANVMQPKAAWLGLISPNALTDDAS